jgi:hypothetical protein
VQIPYPVRAHLNRVESQPGSPANRSRRSAEWRLFRRPRIVARRRFAMEGRSTRAAFLSRGAKGGRRRLGPGGVLRSGPRRPAPRYVGRGHRQAGRDRGAAGDRLLQPLHLEQEVRRRQACLPHCCPLERAGPLRGPGEGPRVGSAEGAQVQVSGRSLQLGAGCRRGWLCAGDRLRRSLHGSGQGAEGRRTQGSRRPDRRQRGPAPDHLQLHRRRNAREEPAFPEVFTAAQATKAVRPFLG